MEDNLILKVVVEDDNQVGIHMGEASSEISPATLVGILEQVKMSIFENIRVEKITRSNKSYDA